MLRRIYENINNLNSKEEGWLLKRGELSEEERKRIEEAWDRIADKVWEKLQYWKKHNPKKYRQFWREIRELEKAFS
jgi:2-oxoglutarate dehydrogenase complex dehydrogenase (E1) component-like enzyme